ncbi:MAG TPA: helix-turn-helix transcriptional regulator, partial [Mycobacteriales bacterium]|nr:helix-turn-helix transcriptional regulator [Mycobacteriales bacterium]
SAFAREVALEVLRYRTEHDLTQVQFGELIGLSQPAVARLEDGEVNPTLKTLARISASTGLDFHLDVVHGTIAMAA